MKEISGTIGGTKDGTVYKGRSASPDRRQPIDAEDLLRWAYGKERVGNCDPGPLPELRDLAAMHGDSGCGIGQIERYVTLGTNVDVPSGRSLEAVHPDALQVLGLVERLEPLARQLVERHARNMDRPDPAGPGPSRWGPQWMVDRSGETVVRVVKWNEQRNPIPPFCPLRWIDTTAAVEAARARYAIWHEAVEGLSRTLIANPWPLSAWRVTGFAAPRPETQGLDRKA